MPQRILYPKILLNHADFTKNLLTYAIIIQPTLPTPMIHSILPEQPDSQINPPIHPIPQTKPIPPNQRPHNRNMKKKQHQGPAQGVMSAMHREPREYEIQSRDTQKRICHPWARSQRLTWSEQTHHLEAKYGDLGGADECGVEQQAVEA
jgi:hypothetical protein